MDTLHPVMAAALAPHLNAQAAIAAATIYRPSANRLREFKTADEAYLYDQQAERYPAVVSLAPAARQAWHDMDRRRVELDEQRADEVHELRERGLL